MEILIIIAFFLFLAWSVDAHSHGAVRHSHSHQGLHTHDEYGQIQYKPEPFVPLVWPTSPLEQERLDEQRRVREEGLRRFNPKAERTYNNPHYTDYRVDVTSVTRDNNLKELPRGAT